MKLIKLPLILIAIFAVTLFANAQSISTGSAINKAGKQRTLAIRMAKDFIAIGSGVKVEEASKELDESASTFNENLRDLLIYSKNKETTDALNFVSTLWAKFRVNVMVAPEVETVDKIIVEANNLMNACNIVVDKIIATSGSKAAVLPNLCGKQRLYSQKIAMLFFAEKWGVSYKTLNKDFDDTVAAYETGLNALVNIPENTDEINAILKFQLSEWAFLKKSFELKAGTTMTASIFSSTNIIFKDFDRATLLYEKIVN
jgi:hypothetical protein